MNNGQAYSRLPQETIDRIWAMWDSGCRNFYEMAQAVGRTYSTTSKLIKSGRRYGVGASPERMASALNQIDLLMKEGMVLEDALAEVGMGAEIYTRERGCSDRKPLKAAIRPKAVKAEAFSPDWWDQNNDSFVARMRLFHPETEIELKTVR